MGMTNVIDDKAPPPRLLTAAEMPQIDANWLQWIAENRLRDCGPETMADTMAAAGLSRSAALAAIHRMESDPAYKAARKHLQLFKKLESVVANQQQVWEQDPNYFTVDRRNRLPTDEFLERYVRGSRPVVLTSLADDWPAKTRWTPDDLKRRFGHLDVEVQADRANDPRYEQNKLDHRRQVRVANFVDQVMAGGPTNDYYLTANNEALRRPDFAPLLDDIGSLPDFCNRDDLAARSSFWFGPAGTVTPLHHDSVMLLHTQIVGRKRWRLISPMQTPLLYNHARVYSPIDLDRPDLARYPRFADARVIDVVVNPGETIFVPLAWWHQVTSLDVSISFSYTCFKFSNNFKYDNPEIWDW